MDDSHVESARARAALAADYAVEVFDDGSTALERLTVTPAPDVIVLDRVMPGVPGTEVCKFIASSANPAIARIGILLLTHQRQTDQIVEGLAAGASDYLAKPYAPEELRARVGALVRTRRLTEKLERLEQVNRRLLAAAPDALVAIDAAGTVTFVNEEAVRTFGSEAKGLVGRPLAQLVPELGLGNARRGPAGNLLPIPLPDVSIGERVFAPTIGILPTDDTADTMIALRDVTEQRRADSRRLDFYAVIAHDLRSPLTTVLMRTSMILQGARGPVPPKVVEDVRKIDVNVKSLVTMINDFLEVARLQGTGYKIHGAELDLAALVDAVMEDFRPLLDTGGLAWRAERPEPPALVFGDARRLTQVLTNLIANAIKFTGAKGTITTRVLVVDAWVSFHVEDTGAGIAPEALHTLFDRYTRSPESEQAIAGTGLGLMIVRDVVQAHGGSVGVESKRDEGSRFWFRLPHAPRAVPLALAAPAPVGG